MKIGIIIQGAGVWIRHNTVLLMTVGTLPATRAFSVPFCDRLPGCVHVHRTRPLLSIPGEQILTFYLSNQERTLMFYPSLFHRAHGSGTRLYDLFRGSKSPYSVYAFIIHPGGANHRLHGRLTQFRRPFLNAPLTPLSGNC